MSISDHGGGAGELPFAGRSCLVVEDNIFALEIMTIFLQRSGLSVDGAENGQQAMEKYLASPGRYDIIFMDLHMPVMGGCEATKSIRGSGLPGCASLPIVAMSGNPLGDLQSLEFNGFLKKPFEMSSILPMLEELVGISAKAHMGC